ncbi:MAG TPA: LLM class flavin-dependent oxidoreductase [Actinomycetota bacterium]|nr:LLM class flavin-dependent oxidoreductase [Actinomycetota bacterium]
MRFGLALPHYDTSYAGRPASWASVVDVARAAEASSFDSVWVSDHLFLDWSKYGGPPDVVGSLECWATLSGLAAKTSTIKLGSLTLCNDFRNPGLVAKMAATLDQLSGGRVELGMGAGWYEPEYEAAGIPFDPPGTRIARLRESVEILTRLLDGEELFYSGEYYVLKGAICRPGPFGERPPIWVGGKGDYLLSAAAAVADGWNFSWLGSFDAYKERSEAASAACEKVGRDPKTLRRSVGAYVFTGRDDTDLRRRFERLMEVTPAGILGDTGDPGVSWERFRETRVAGTVAEVTDRLGRLADLGVEEVIVSLGALPFQVADIEDVELVGAEIASSLKT